VIGAPLVAFGGSHLMARAELVGRLAAMGGLGGGGTPAAVPSIAHSLQCPGPCVKAHTHTRSHNIIKVIKG